MKFFENGNQITAQHAKEMALDHTDQTGGDRAETLAIWARLSRDEDAREMIADITDGELEIMVE